MLRLSRGKRGSNLAKYLEKFVTPIAEALVTVRGLEMKKKKRKNKRLMPFDLTHLLVVGTCHLLQPVDEQVLVLFQNQKLAQDDIGLKS